MIAEARLKPADASKFLKRLIHHFSLKIPATYDTQRGHAQFEMGTCDAEVQGDDLYLRVEAENEQDLQTVKDVIARHVEHFGQRENLKVEWN